MDLVEQIKQDLEKGYSKADLERLIGLPQNSLSSVIAGTKTLSKKSELKIEKFMASEKPDPLSLIVPKKKIENKHPRTGVIESVMDKNGNETENAKKIRVQKQISNSDGEIDFGDDVWLIIEKYTKFPSRDKPTNNFEYREWLKKKAAADNEIKVAWQNRKRN